MNKVEGCGHSGYKIHARSAMLPDGGHRDYIYFEAMHTRIDILASFAKSTRGKTSGQIVEWAEPTYETTRLADDISASLAELEAVGNRFDPESELSHVNLEAYRCRMPLSSKLYDILCFCFYYNKLTDGLFDITAGSFDGKPTRADEVVIYDDHSISFKDKRICLDLSGVLKGFALDEIRNIMNLYGIADAFISVGTSSILAMGSHDHTDVNKRGWSVSLRPNSDRVAEADTASSFQLCDECLTTSGNDSPQRAHIINPLTGQLIKGMRTASVVTESGAIGEVLSMACFLASADQLRKLKQKFNIKKVVISQPLV